MNNKSCVSIMKDVVEEASKQFGIRWSVDDEKYDILNQYCMAFDKLSNQFEASMIEFSVDNITMESTISLGCNTIEVFEKRHLFYSLMIRATRMNIRPDGEDIIVSMTFPSIWCHA